MRTLDRTTSRSLSPTGFPEDSSPAIVWTIQTPQKQTSTGSIFMKRRSAIALLALGFAALSYSPQASSQTGWVMLFDGKTMDNFSKVGDANWRIEDGMIVSDKGNGFLVTKTDYKDYQIRA